MGTKYIAFLRAINVGGHTVKMEALRGLFEAMGFRNVETFIASGNIIFEAGSQSTGTLEKKIEQTLLEAHRHMLEAIRRRDVDGARLWARRHLDDWRKGFERAGNDLDQPIDSLYLREAATSSS